MSKYTEKAVELFKQGYNCSQSVAAAFAEEFGLDEETVLKLASGFGGGIGRMRSVCGAFSGSVMLVGMMHDSHDKTSSYEDVRKLAEQFKADNGSLICAELLGLKKPECSAVPEARTEEYYKKRPCVQIVESAAAAVEKILLADKKEQ